VSDIVKPSGEGPVSREDCERVWVVLSLPEDGSEAGSLEAQLKAAYAGEERTERQWHAGWWTSRLKTPASSPRRAQMHMSPA